MTIVIHANLGLKSPLAPLAATHLCATFMKVSLHIILQHHPLALPHSTLVLAQTMIAAMVCIVFWIRANPTVTDVKEPAILDTMEKNANTMVVQVPLARILVIVADSVNRLTITADAQLAGEDTIVQKFAVAVTPLVTVKMGALVMIMRNTDYVVSVQQDSTERDVNSSRMKRLDAVTLISTTSEQEAPPVLPIAQIELTTFRKCWQKESHMERIV
jgi:hypothetical protein